MKLVREILYEKFTDGGDPIRDMGIGIYSKHDFKTEIDLLQWIWDMLPTLCGGSIPKDIINNPHDTGFFKHDYIWYNIVGNYISKYITLRGKEYRTNWKGNNALHNALMRKGYKVSKYFEHYWEDARFFDPPDFKIKESLNEVFTDQSDPIRDMGISLSVLEIAEFFCKEFGGNIDKISMAYFGDKKHIGYACVIREFFMHIKFSVGGLFGSPISQDRIQDAFFRACENENYWGDREDIVKDRTIIANVLKKYFNIYVDPDIYKYHDTEIYKKRGD